VVVISHDPKVERMIVGGFVPYFASAGLNSEIYMSVAVGDTNRLLAFTADGLSYFEVEIPKSVGLLACPPLSPLTGKSISSANKAWPPSTRPVRSFGRFRWVRPAARASLPLCSMTNWWSVMPRLLGLKSDGKMLF